jgi:hypothetical protein
MSKGEGFPSQIIYKVKWGKKKRKKSKSQERRQEARRLARERCLEQVRGMTGDPVVLAELRGKCLHKSSFPSKVNSNNSGTL